VGTVGCHSAEGHSAPLTLNCFGQSGAMGNPPNQGYGETLHVDLKASRFCFKDCVQWFSIKSFDKNRIVFQQSTPSGEYPHGSALFLDRRSMRLHVHEQDAGVGLYDNRFQAVCQVEQMTAPIRQKL
jgi:hypothetical protein